MKKSIFDYKNYRKFLKDYYLHQKSEKTGFTYKKFSEKAGIKSPNFYKLVVDGTKNLNQSNMQKFSKTLKLTEEENIYFEVLVNYNQAKDSDQKKHYLRKVKHLKDANIDKQTQTKKISDSEFIGLESWLTFAIIELIKLPAFKEDLQWIKKSLFNMVNEDQINDLLNKLIDKGIILKDEKGKLHNTTAQIFKSTDLKHKEMQEYYKSWAVRQVASFNLSSHKDLIATSLTFTIPDKTVEKARQKIKDFTIDLAEMLAEEEGEGSVYAFNFAGFPLSQKN